jgi:hypothetical protein
MAKKIVRLTESDMIRLVKKVVNEQTRFSLDEPHYIFDRKKGMVALIEQTPKMVRRVLKNLPPNLQYLAIINCDFADFEDIDMCSLNQLKNVNLIGTESNFEEQGYDCLNKWDEKGQWH